MAKKDYSEDPPDHFREIFHKTCLSCEHLFWHRKYWYVCEKHKFRFGAVSMGRNGDPQRRKCNDYVFKRFGK